MLFCQTKKSTRRALACGKQNTVLSCLGSHADKYTAPATAAQTDRTRDVEKLLTWFKGTATIAP